MKRFLAMLMVVICLAGVVVLGYFVFIAKSIESVVLDGEIQTLYVVGDDIDFGNAKLKVTYKNGSIKLIDLDKDMITGFNTNSERADQQMGTISINYKSADTISINYTVLATGMYYTSSSLTVYASQTSKSSAVQYTPSTTTRMFEILAGGKLRYYEYSSSKWFVNDGNFDSTYYYDIVGDTMYIYLGGDEAEYKLVVTYSNGVRTISSTEYSYNSVYEDLTTSKTVYTYSYVSTIENNPIVSIELDLSKATTSSSNSKAVVFYVGDTIKSSNNKIYLKVTYTEPRIYYSSNSTTITQLKTVYIEVTDEMLSSSLLTGGAISSPTTATIYYEDYTYPVYLYYIVKVR